MINYSLPEIEHNLRLVENTADYRSLATSMADSGNLQLIGASLNKPHSSDCIVHIRVCACVFACLPGLITYLKLAH